jgi:predicted nucleic-acid-binding protein
MPTTMDEPATQAPDPQEESASRLFHALTQTMAAYVRSEIALNLVKEVDRMVQNKFDELVQNRNTLALLDVEMKKEIADMIETAIESHEGRDAHFDKDTIEQSAADQARETLREYAERQEGWVTKDQVNDIITEHVDEELDRIDWEERVKDVLREML